MPPLLALLLAGGVREISVVRVDPVGRWVEVTTRWEGLAEGTGVTLPSDPEVPAREPAELDHYQVYPNRRERAQISGDAARLRIRLPRRFGTFGCVDGLCTLAGGFCPRVSGVTPELQVEAVRGRAYTDGELVVVGTGLHAERAGAWLWIGRGSGARALAVAVRAAPGGGTLLEVPLRRELARRRGAVVLVSDRLFRVAPPLRIYHERALLAALGDPAAPPPAADLRARLRRAGWVPAVDQLLFARQVAFADAYFFADPGPHWKLVWENLGAVASADTLELHGSVELALRRSDDLTHTTRFGLFHDAASQVGGFVGYRHGFGRPADPNRRAGAAGLTLALARLDQDFARLGAPGSSVSLSAGLAWDDRAWPVDPWRYQGAAVEATWRRVAVGDLPTASQGIATLTLQGARPIVPGLSAAALARAAATFGDLAYAGQMLAAGGPLGLRGFGSDELLGRTVVLGRAELRRTFARSWDFNLAHLASLRGIGMALFWEGALVGSCESPLRIEGYQDAGLTLRAFFDWAGLVPSTLELDLAFPLDRRPRSCLGIPTSPGAPDGGVRSPTAVLLRFGPSF